MKKTILIVLFSLSGCAATPQKQSDLFDSDTITTPNYLDLPETFHDQNGYGFKTQSRKWTVGELKGKYKEATGNDLTSVSAGLCGWDEGCYQKAYIQKYQEGINTYRKAFYAEIEREKQKEEESCMANKECWKEKNTNNAIVELRTQYMAFLGINQYQQSDADMIARKACRSAGVAQRNGVSASELKNRFRLIEGLSPQNRYTLSALAQACWTLSKYGIADGTEKIDP